MARSHVVRIALENLGIDPQRFALEWVSSAEAPRFAQLVTRFTEKIRALGPNPLRETAANQARCA